LVFKGANLAPFFFGDQRNDQGLPRCRFLDCVGSSGDVERARDADALHN
jgi:hypothetical protein